MIELIEIFILAIAQGIGEFLPISSSGHNAVLVHLFERFGTPLTDDSSEFVKLNILLHVGSLVAVLIIFRQRIINMLTKDFRLIPLLIVATIPAVAVGYPIHKLFPWLEDFLLLISVCFIVTGFLLLYTLRLPEGTKTTSTMSWLDAFSIGCVQAVAVLPGISRSGSTIVAGLCRKLKREEAAAFSFLLSIPIIAGGGFLEGLHMISDAKIAHKIEQRAVEFYDANGFREDQSEAYEVFLHELCGKKTLKRIFYKLINKDESEIFAKWRASEKGEKVEARIQYTAEQLFAGKTIADLQDSAMPGWFLFVGMLASCVAGIIALVFLLDWIKKGKLWYFAIWVFVMSPITMALALLPMPEKSEPQEPAGVQSVEPLQEKVLANERVSEWTLINEERKALPLVDVADKLIPFDQSDRIWITPDRKNVILFGRVVLREGFLELLACRVRTKEHESILSVRVKPYLIRAALLAVNANEGKPMQMKPVFIPATGSKIDITLRWKDESGTLHESPAQDWVWDMSSPENAKKRMTTHWVFSGSMEYQDDVGAYRFLANETGELFGLSNFVGSILDVPIESSADNTKLQFGCFTECIPPVDTLVTIVLTPKR